MVFWFEDNHISTVAECYHKLYIDYGYRNPKSVKAAMLSLFAWHNESMNIWSHLIGAICVLVAGINFSFDFFASSMPPLELIALEVYICCAVICLLLSALFHWLCCCSEVVNDTLLKMDFAGIGLLITGSYVPAVYYGFHCTPDIQQVHFALTGVIFAVGMYAPWMSDHVRPYALASLAAFGALPFVHWLYITPSEFTSELVHGFLSMGFWYGAGFGFYVTAFPECKWPQNWFITHVMPSHTLWHLCVLSAVYVWFRFLFHYRLMLDQLGCAPYGSCEANGTCSANALEPLNI